MNRRKFLKNIGVASLIGVIGINSVGATDKVSTTGMIMHNMNIRELLLDIRNSLNDERYIEAFKTMSQFNIEAHYGLMTRELYQFKYGEHITVYPTHNFKSRWHDSASSSEKIGAYIIVDDEKNKKRYMVNQHIILEGYAETHGFKIICDNGSDEVNFTNGKTSRIIV